MSAAHEEPAGSGREAVEGERAVRPDLGVRWRPPSRIRCRRGNPPGLEVDGRQIEHPPADRDGRQADEAHAVRRRGHEHGVAVREALRVRVEVHEPRTRAGDLEEERPRRSLRLLALGCRLSGRHVVEVGLEPRDVFVADRRARGIEGAGDEPALRLQAPTGCVDHLAADPEARSKAQRDLSRVREGDVLARGCVPLRDLQRQGLRRRGQRQLATTVGVRRAEGRVVLAPGLPAVGLAPPDVDVRDPAHDSGHGPPGGVEDHDVERQEADHLQDDLRLRARRHHRAVPVTARSQRDGLPLGPPGEGPVGAAHGSVGPGRLEVDRHPGHRAVKQVDDTAAHDPRPGGTGGRRRPLPRPILLARVLSRRVPSGRTAERGLVGRPGRPGDPGDALEVPGLLDREPDHEQQQGRHQGSGRDPAVRHGASVVGCGMAARRRARRPVHASGVGRGRARRLTADVVIQWRDRRPRTPRPP